MPIQIVIFGLGRLGASLAAAIAPRPELTVSGYDPEPETARQAHHRKWISRVEGDPLAAAGAADLLVLALPLNQQRDLLKLTAPALRAGSVTLTLAPLLAPALAWAAESLPAERYFVAGHALLSADRLQAEAGPDLYKDGRWALAAAPGCVPEALKAATDLASLAGAAPYFLDAAEHDGLMGGASALPALLAWALLRATAGSTGWGDLRQLAGQSFLTAGQALAEMEPGEVSLNPANAARYLDVVVEELGRLRGWLAAGAAGEVEAALAQAQEQRARWAMDHASGDWEPNQSAAPQLSMGEQVGRMFLGGLIGNRRRDP